MEKTTSSTEAVAAGRGPVYGSADDTEYGLYLDALRRRVAAARGPAFTTDVDGAALYDAFLTELPPERRQHYECRACRRFVAQYGGLVWVEETTGSTIPLLWATEDAPDLFHHPVKALERIVRRATITGVFYSRPAAWGTHSNHDAKRGCTWRHLSATPPPNLIHKPSGLGETPEQRSAEKLQEYEMVRRALGEFPPGIAIQARQLLATGNLPRSEKFLGAADWFCALHDARDGTTGRERRDNLTWLAVATAPTGFAHLRGGVLGTLLEDVKAGRSFEAIRASFAGKVDPLQYQRPQAAPTAGNIAQAEEVVRKMGLAPALRRRFAKLSDVEALWRPRAAEVAAGNGVFGHLRAKDAEALRALQVPQPTITMTWAKFRQTCLPEAVRLWCFVHSMPGPFAALVTAADPEAPPILQWDRPERRNPVSWYLYHRGSWPSVWGLEANEYREVSAVVLKPPMWGGEDEFRHQGRAVFLLLDGCRDLKHEKSGGLFPESLRSELHGVRATIEAHSKEAKIEGAAEANACGLMLQEGVPWSCMLRVKDRAGTTLTYRLDRWD